MTQHFVTLADMLAAKEERSQRQAVLRQAQGLPLISITLNMPGPCKDLPVLRRLCAYAVTQLRRELTVTAEQLAYLPTGPEALLTVTEAAEAVKACAVRLEERTVFGRLLDIDVFTADGRLLSRKDSGEGRGCFVCGGSSLVCMRERRHDAAALQMAVERMLTAFCAAETRSVSPAAEQIGALAVEAMLYEVTATPSPGLVDRVNSGAHRDMDFYSFMSSSAALALPLARCAEAGLRHDGELPALLPVLRVIGLEGEQAMFAATGGVNTQKGLLFVIGLLAAAAGWLSRRGESLTAAAVLQAGAAMVSGIVETELAAAAAKAPAERTAGERLFLEYGVTGVRGEMAAGLPGVKAAGLPALTAALAAGLPVNDALIQTLLVLMTCVDDTTVMNRHHPDKVRVWLRQRAEAVLAAGGMTSVAGQQAVSNLDAECIADNVSPGGVADLLAVTWFLHRLAGGAVKEVYRDL